MAPFPGNAPTGPLHSRAKSSDRSRPSAERLLLFCLVLGGLVAGTVGCGASSPVDERSPVTPSSTATSGIAGLVTVQGGLVKTPIPASGERVDVHRGDATGEVVASRQSDAEGMFKAKLPPGRYTLVHVPYDDKMAHPVSVTVAPGEWAPVTVGLSVR